MKDFLKTCYDAIRRQGTVIASTINAVSPDCVNRIDATRFVILIGCGDSFAVAEYGKWAFLHIGIPAIALSPTEVLHFPLSTKHTVIGITASGRSISTINALMEAKRAGSTIIVLTDNADGRANPLADHLWLTSSGVSSYNISPSAPTTAAMAYLLKVAGLLSSPDRDTLIHDISRMIDISGHVIDWADSLGRSVSSTLNTGHPLYVISEGPNFAASMIGMMKFNEYSLVRANAVLREEFQHHYNLSIRDGDQAILVTQSPSRDADQTYLNILRKTLKMSAVGVHASAEFELRSALGQSIINAITLQMIAYHTAVRLDPEKEWFKLPNAEAFRIY